LIVIVVVIIEKQAADVILEVLDARDPLGCRCKELEQAIFSEFNYTKKVILVLNKVDLVPRCT
jgi:nuclear GTP-binding protein